jgi:hypothetical protein
MQCLSPVEVGVGAAGNGVNSLYFVYHIVYDFRKFVLFLTNKPISRVPDSERYSNKETIQNKNKTKTKTHN